jgi:O-methyltransferase
MSIIPSPSNPASVSRELYLDLLKKCLSFSLWRAKDGSLDFGVENKAKRAIKALLKGGARTSESANAPAEARDEGRDWPVLAHTMIGMKRLNNLQFCVESVLQSNVPGDLIETGVWRGGATILMRAILKAYGVVDRTVWVADSFAGLPPPDPQYPADSKDKHHTKRPLEVSLEQVRENFTQYGLLDDQVRFLKGWFKDTLPGAPISKLSVIRLDGDMYQSTMDGLVNLYPKLSPGGYLIVDDFGAVPGCRQAVEDFRKERGITEPVTQIDWTGVFWQRGK